MEPQELAEWLAKGLGRAVLALRGCDSTPFRDTILHACRHDQRVDGRSEDSRGRYLYDVIRATGEPDFYRDCILAALAVPADDDDQDQLFDIARMFAQAGDVGARQAMYAAFERNALTGDPTGAFELVQLDGIDGFLFAFGLLEGIEKTEDDWLPGWWILKLEERDGKGPTWECLDQAAATNTRLRNLLDQERDEKRKREEAWQTPTALSRLISIPYTELHTLIHQRDPKLTGYALSRWGERASEENLLAAAADLLAELDRDRLSRYIRLFDRRAFPLEPSKLLELSQGDDDEIASLATFALTPIRHPEVRARAISLLSQPRWVPEAVGMLCSNSLPGDELLIEGALDGPEYDQDIRHRVGLWARDFTASHSDVSARILRMLYETTPCSTCRKSAVAQLIESGDLPNHVREECRWDASAETRELAAEAD